VTDPDLPSVLTKNQWHWLVTGAAGFIGSNLCEYLVRNNQRVTAFDNLATGHLHNIQDVQQIAAQLNRTALFKFIQGDATVYSDAKSAATGVDFVLHQAALGSVPRSIKTPLASHNANVDGFINIIDASVNAKVKRFVYASSSSVYGDSAELPKVEERTGSLLSPYAATKAINETYASVFQRCYGIECVGLRYFNVFGRRQDPNGPYAAVIPKWLLALLQDEPLIINGDGQTSRDFCYIDNVVQANIRAALFQSALPEATALNIAFGDQTDLNRLASMLRQGLANAQGVGVETLTAPVQYRDFRAGDVRHSLASIAKAKAQIGYQPTHSLAQGLVETCSWYLSNRERLL
jgi:UDP-N-acetylglucosamine/UDP-N-acetylgalactosamine 4-epimerase